MNEYWNSTSLRENGIPLGYRLITETEIIQLNFRKKRRIPPADPVPLGLKYLEQTINIQEIGEEVDRNWFLFERGIGSFGKIHKETYSIEYYNNRIPDSIISVIIPLEYQNSSNPIPLGRRLLTEKEIKYLNESRIENGKYSGLKLLEKIITLPNELNLNRNWFLFEKSLGSLGKINKDNSATIDYNIGDSIIAILKPLEYLNSFESIPLGKKLISRIELDKLGVIGRQKLIQSIIPKPLYNVKGYSGSRKWILFERGKDLYTKLDRDSNNIENCNSVAIASILILKPNDNYVETQIESNNPSTPKPLDKQVGNMQPKNIILYGPPGTGKTYNCIDKAVEITLPDEYASDDHKTNKDTFDDLRNKGQIEFVTFHQNYSYEDFVVGISPDVDSGTLDYPLFFGQQN
jgi:hypothetical protein